MRPFAFATLAAISFFGLTACNQEPETTALSKILEAQRTFERLDGNKDGVVSNNEAATVASIDFGTADKDKNGALTPEEFEVAVVDPTPPG
jgi:hypothetical protein